MMSAEKPALHELELENSYLKTENTALKAEILVLQTELETLKTYPEFSAGFDESLKNISGNK